MLAALLCVQHTNDGSTNSSHAPSLLQGTFEIDDRTSSFVVIS
jgi:hypothetical protein